LIGNEFRRIDFYIFKSSKCVFLVRVISEVVDLLSLLVATNENDHDNNEAEGATNDADNCSDSQAGGFRSRSGGAAGSSQAIASNTTGQIGGAIAVDNTSGGSGRSGIAGR